MKNGVNSWRAAIGLCAVMTIVTACEDAPMVPGALETAPVQLDIVSGNNQSGAPGAELANPLVVRILDGSGKPVPSQIVNFKVTQGGGTVYAGAAITNAQGIAQERWTLGTEIGSVQTVDARAVDPGTGEKRVFATFSAVVTDPATAISTVAVNPSSASIVIGGTQQLSAVAQNSSGNSLSGKTFSWSSSNTGVATVSTSGLVTAVSAGSATITATSEGQSGTSSINVTAPAAQAGEIGSVTDLRSNGTTSSSVTLTWTQVSDGAGGAAKYAIRYATPTMTWWTASATEVSVTGSAVGQPISYTFTGLTASTAYQFQLVTYSGTLNVDANFGGTSNVASATTSAASGSTSTVSTVSVSPNSASLLVGETRQLSAVARNSSGTTISGKTFTWSSSNTSIATVSSSGLVTARAAGSATITATTDGKSGTSAMTVTAPAAAPPPPSGTTGNIISDDFESGNFSKWSELWNSSDIALVNDPTGLRGGKVARFTYSTRSGAANDRNVTLTKFVTGTGLRNFFFRGYVFIPVTGTNSVAGKQAWQRKLLYFKDVGENNGNIFVLSLHGDGDGDGSPSLKVITQVNGVDTSPTGPGGYTNIEVPLGQWVYLEVEFAANTPGSSNGELRVWVNNANTPVYQRTDVNLFGSLSEGYGTFMIGQQLQTGDGDPAQTEYRYWDNVALSTSRLGQ